MKSQASRTGEWQVVNRRKNVKMDQRKWNNPTSFFVGNIPNGYGLNDLKEVFKSFGDLVDVYLAHKKDKSGSNFGFIRYSGVSDVVKFEEDFGKIYLGSNVLSINLSRYQRNNRLIRPNAKPSHPPPPSAPKLAWDFRCKRSFANVVSGYNIVKPKNPTRIKLCSSPDLEVILSESFLVGEVNDSEMLKALPNLLKNGGINFGRVFFYGGLHVLIGFDDKSEALGFMENENCWNVWFKWLKTGNHTIDLKHNRASDIKIIGLPVQYRTIDNITKILDNFGKVLMVETDLWKNDLSHCSGCILTDSLTRLNEEIVIETECGDFFSIGIIEKEFNLKPFGENNVWDVGEFINVKDLATKDNLGNESVDSDSISNSSDDEWEDGEIRTDDQTILMEIPNVQSPLMDACFPEDEFSGVAINIPTTMAADETIIEESVGYTSIKNVAPVFEKGEIMPKDKDEIDSPMNTVVESVINGVDEVINAVNLGSGTDRDIGIPQKSHEIIYAEYLDFCSNKNIDMPHQKSNEITSTCQMSQDSMDTLNASDNNAHISVIEDSVLNKSDEVPSNINIPLPFGDINGFQTFENQIFNASAPSNINIPFGDNNDGLPRSSTISNGTSNASINLDLPVQIHLAPMYTNGSCFSFGSTFKKRRKFSPTRRS